MADDGIEFVTPSRVTKKIIEDESLVWNKRCPYCGDCLICLWGWKERRYVSARCQGLKCNYITIFK